MDRNSAIGLTLIAVLLLLYFNFFSPTPQPPSQSPEPVISKDTLSSKAMPSFQVPPSDSLLQSRYGQLATYMKGELQTTKIETPDLAVTLSNNATIHELQLSRFKTYSQQPLYLVTPGTNTFSLKGKLNGQEVDLYKLYYETVTEKRGDSTIVSLQALIDENTFVRHRYTIPPVGYLIYYKLETKGVEGLINNQFVLDWTDKIPLQEKDLTDSRNKTTINYFTANGSFAGISETSTELKTETFSNPVKWTAIRQKFFVSAILSNTPFAGGEVSTVVNAADINTVKDAKVRLFISANDVDMGKSAYRFYFGPNDYKIIRDVEEGFSENLSLGWPPVIWVNKFLIIPTFKFLEQYIANYGVIIIILVLLIKLILSPLSYKSYIGMAKMRLLKPELDLIKEKYGENMTQIQAEQMKLYQLAGVSPFSGCIPLLLQLPILFAMFYFFPVSIELRQKQFLWAEDLSTYDSIINLPFTIPFYGSHVSLFVLLMTASTIVYTWQNNQLTSVQGPMKSMSYIMPVIFMFVLNSFSAGLSFYYFVSNLITFGQQEIIKRLVDENKIKAVMDEHRKKMEAGGGPKSKFMSKLQEAMKASEEAKKKSKK